MDAVNGGKPSVSEKKRLSGGRLDAEPPVLSRCEPVNVNESEAEPASSPPSLRRETYVTRKKKLLNGALRSNYSERVASGVGSVVDRNRNGATSGFGKVALRLIKRKKKRQRKRLTSRRATGLSSSPIRRRTTRLSCAQEAELGATATSNENSQEATDIVEPAVGSGRILRPRKIEGEATPETVKPKSSPVHIPKDAAVKDKLVPEEVDVVDGVEILGFSTLEDLQKFTEAEEALKGPTHVSDEDEVDVEYFSDLEESSSALVESTVTNNASFSVSLHSDSSRASLLDSDGETDSSRYCQFWNMKDGSQHGQDLDDEASCSSSRNTMSGILDKPKKSAEPSDERTQGKKKVEAEMPKVGMAINVGLGRVMRPHTARNIHQLLDQTGSISGKMAEFSASVVTQKNCPEPNARIVMPVVCPKMLDLMKYKWLTGDRGRSVTLATVKAAGTVRATGSMRAVGTAKAATSTSCNAACQVIPSSRSARSVAETKKLLLQPLPSGSGIKTDKGKRKAEAPKGRPPKKANTATTKDINNPLKKGTDATSNKESSTTHKEAKSTNNEATTRIQKEDCNSTTTKEKDKNDKVKTTIEMKQPCSVIEGVVREMVDFVSLRDEVHPIPYDPDQKQGRTSKEEKSLPPAKIAGHKKTTAGLLAELRRLDVTVFDMDGHAESSSTSENVPVDGNCTKDTCRLGCVCESIAGRRTAMPTHCGRVDCMFECSCSSISYERRRTEGRHLLDVSDATLAWIQDESERNLAKVERQFKQTVVRANDDLIVMGSKRSRREIKMPERYREDFVTNKEYMILHPHHFEMSKFQKRSFVPTTTPPLTPTNKSLSPSKLLTPTPTPPKPPKLGGPPIIPAKTAKPPPTSNVSPVIEDVALSSCDEESPSEGTKPCSVFLHRIDPDKPFRIPRRNVAVKSTSKVRHMHNILHSSARTTSRFVENRLQSRKNRCGLSALLATNPENDVFCHIVKEHSISNEEWEKSGVLAEQAGDKPPSPLKKNADSLQLVPWSFLKEKFHKNEYYIWYKCQGGNKPKLYLTDNPEKPNKSCINLRDVEATLHKDLPPLISRLVVKSEDFVEEGKDPRCFLKSVGDHWLIAGYMQRADTPSGSLVPTPLISENTNAHSNSDIEEDVIVDEPKVTKKKNPKCPGRSQAQARWWLLHLTKSFDILRFQNLHLTVKYSQIEKTAQLANADLAGKFFRMPLRESGNFGLYGVPGMPHCVLIGPYGLEEEPDIKAYALSSSTDNRYLRVPLQCVSKDTDCWELDRRGVVKPKTDGSNSKRVLGSWLYDFKPLDFGRDNKIVNCAEPRLSETEQEKTPDTPKSQNQTENSKVEEKSSSQTQNPRVGRVKVRQGQSLLKASDKVKAIDKNLLSVQIEGKAEEALVHVTQNPVPEAKDPSVKPRRGVLKIRRDLMSVPAPPPPPPENDDDAILVDDEEDYPDPSSMVESTLGDGEDLEKVEPKKDYIISDVKHLGFIPVTNLRENAVVIPHLSVPGQVHLFTSHDEIVKFVFKTIRQKILFIGVRPENMLWRQVDSLEDVCGEKQFNPGVLAGNHVITKAGLINLVALTEEDIGSLDLHPKDAEELSARLDHIKSLPLIRQLGRLLVGPAGPLPQNAILSMAVTEIRRLQAQSRGLKMSRAELLADQDKMKSAIDELLLNGVPEDVRLEVRKQVETALHSDKPIIVLDEDSGSDGEASTSRPPSEFAVSEMVSLASSDSEAEDTAIQAPEGAHGSLPVVRSSVNPFPPPNLSAAANSILPDVSSDVSSDSSPATLTPVITPPATTPQGLVCKFPFSPLRRVNVTVMGDGIVTTTPANGMIRLNPARTYSRVGQNSETGLFKTIKIVNTKTLQKMPMCRTRILQAQPRVGGAGSLVRPPLKPSPGAQLYPVLKAMPNVSGAMKPGNPGPRAVLMTRSGTTLPMTVVKTGDPYVRVVGPVRDNTVLITQAPVGDKPGVESIAAVKPSGLKVLHPNLPKQRPGNSSPTKPQMIRILKPVPPTLTGDTHVKLLLSPPKTALPNIPATPAVAEIDTTELVID